MHKLTLHLLFTQLLLCFCLFAEEAPEIESPAQEKVIFYHYPGEEHRIHQVDTLLDELEFYNFVFQPGSFAVHTGNVGGPSMQYERFQLPDFGFSFSPVFFGEWQRKPENLKIYQNTFPYTDLNLMFGTAQKVMARAVHSQPIGSGFHLSGDFQRINSGGTYVRQRNLNNHLSFHLNYISPQGNYSADVAYFFNNHRGQVNGGFADVEYLKNNPNINTDLVPVQFSNAERFMRNSTFFILQEWKFGDDALIQKENHLTRDSADATTDTIWTLPEFSPFRLYHQLEFTSNSYLFRDRNPNEENYPEFFTPPSDSVFRESQSRVIAQKIGLRSEIPLSRNSSIESDTILQSEAAHFYYDLHAGSSLIENKLLFSSDAFLQFETVAKAGYSGKIINAGIQSGVIFGGFNSGDYFIESDLHSSISEAVKLGFIYRHQKGKAPYLFNKMESNVFSYENLLPAYTANVFNFNIAWLPANLSLDIQAVQLNNYFYFASEGIPAFVDGSFWDLNASLSHHIRFGRFGFKNDLTFRHLTDNTAYDVPAMNFLHSIYYENNLFNNAMMLRLGLNIRHYTPYFLPGYDPLTNVFFRQTEWKPDYHPIADLFLNLKIQTVRVSASLTHLNARLYPSETAWAAYRHPVSNMTFQLGIKWMFYN